MRILLDAIWYAAVTGMLLVLASILSWRLKWTLLVSKETLPPVLSRNHMDWWPWLRWIPRNLSAFVGGADPVQLLGTNSEGHHQDVPAPGTWCLSWPIHFAVLTKNGFIFGAGIRRDYVDGYWTLRIVCRKN